MISPETLRRFSLFSGLDSAVLEDLATAGEEVKFKQGEWLFKEGKEAERIVGGMPLEALEEKFSTHIK